LAEEIAKIQSHNTVTKEDVIRAIKQTEIELLENE
jgi:histone H3/H4